MIRASNENWFVYLERVREHLPEGFEDDCTDDGLANKTGTYIFVSFMNNIGPKSCADNLIFKLGVDDGEL